MTIRHTIILIATALFVICAIYALNHTIEQKQLSSSSLNNNNNNTTYTYLEPEENGRDVTEAVGGDKVSDKWSYEEFIEEDTNKRVVLLAGPHKTGKF